MSATCNIVDAAFFEFVHNTRRQEGHCFTRSSRAGSGNLNFADLLWNDGSQWDECSTSYKVSPTAKAWQFHLHPSAAARLAVLTVRNGYWNPQKTAKDRRGPRLMFQPDVRLLGARQHISCLRKPNNLWLQFGACAQILFGYLFQLLGEIGDRYLVDPPAVGSTI